MNRSVEPVDQRTRDSLQKSVTLAIEITTQSQEAAAKREAERIEQVWCFLVVSLRVPSRAHNQNPCLFFFK